MTIQQSLDSLKVFPHFTGIWEGEWVSQNLDQKVVRKNKSLITHKIINNQLIQTNENTYADGTTEKIDFTAKLIDDETIEFESPNPPYCNFKMLVKECFDNLIILQGWDKKTGILVVVETINFVNSNLRVRTLQEFEPQDGKPIGFTHIIEHRVG